MNIIQSSSNYELAVMHGHELVDAAERRRQTHRFQQWMSSRRQSGSTPPSGR